MKISQLHLSPLTRVETPTDAHAIVDNEFRRNAYIERYGDVNTFYDVGANLWRVPAFRDRIRAYTKAKAEDCRRWGSE